MSKAFYALAVARECLARRGEDLTFFELECWAGVVVKLAAEARRSDPTAFDKIRGFDFRTKDGGVRLPEQDCGDGLFIVDGVARLNPDATVSITGVPVMRGNPKSGPCPPTCGPDGPPL